jgi:beta-galactosidase GanA
LDTYKLFIAGKEQGWCENKALVYYLFAGKRLNLRPDQLADTYIDMSNYKKGVVWVNGHNLGRYWEIGPQYRLYCPAPWLNKGMNEIIVFDLHQLEAMPIKGVKELY